MTWAKYGVEFFDQCADFGLSDAAVRTHTEALHYLYRLEDMEMRILKHLVRRFAGSADWEQAAKDLVAHGFWRDEGDAYVVEHHGDVFRQSLFVQLKHRDDERERQRRKRAKDERDVAANNQPNVGTNVTPTQTDRHTDIQTPSTGDVGMCSGCGTPIDSGAWYAHTGRHPGCATAEVS
ncbi:hypothetical protein JOF29_007916 [Kribbella aluminosa]|uniref:Uncharacterized protein n=1 Tax=Kribbella aluminosa TaxID=416017 RepID=A0ABS4UYS4_9ACTN|nr:hypothetical protein [Kribbella aluminosa]MBP2356806.1 hypothetical protein [Kribbella aluminosa]